MNLRSGKTISVGNNKTATVNVRAYEVNTHRPEHTQEASTINASTFTGATVRTGPTYINDKYIGNPSLSNTFHMRLRSHTRNRNYSKPYIPTEDPNPLVTNDITKHVTLQIKSRLDCFTTVRNRKYARTEDYVLECCRLANEIIYIIFDEK